MIDFNFIGFEFIAQIFNIVYTILLLCLFIFIQYLFYRIYKFIFVNAYELIIKLKDKLTISNNSFAKIITKRYKENE